MKCEKNPISRNLEHAPAPCSRLSYRTSADVLWHYSHNVKIDFRSSTVHISFHFYMSVITQLFYDFSIRCPVHVHRTDSQAFANCSKWLIFRSNRFNCSLREKKDEKKLINKFDLLEHIDAFSRTMTNQQSIWSANRCVPKSRWNQWWPNCVLS